MPQWRSNRRDNEDRGRFSTPGFIALLIVCAILIAFDRPQNRGEVMSSLRAGFNDISTPVLDVAAWPVRGLVNIGPWWRRQIQLARQNRDLEEELAEQRAWRDVALSLRDRVQLYEQALNLESPVSQNRITAWVVAEQEGPFVRSQLVGVGRNDGVQPGFPVVNVYGLVGRTVDVGQNSSRVLQLTDFNSRIAVMADRSNARAMLTGDNGDYPVLDYLGDQADIREGDRIVTSGDDNVMPRGLPIGEALQDRNGQWRVVLYSDTAPLDLVWIWPFDPLAAPEDNPALFRETPQEDEEIETPDDEVIISNPEPQDQPAQSEVQDTTPDTSGDAPTRTAEARPEVQPVTQSDSTPVRNEPTSADDLNAQQLSAPVSSADDLNALQLQADTQAPVLDNEPVEDDEASEDIPDFPVISAADLIAEPPAEDASGEETENTDETDDDEEEPAGEGN